MSGDYSRRRFDPLKDYSGVLMQQGRVQLDADWNELVEIEDRRHRAESLDTIGRTGVPRETPDAFRIDMAGGVPTVGPGRMYVDGLLPENHGQAPPDPADPTPPLGFDATLGEPRGSEALPYTAQPWLPNVAAVAPFPTSGGPHLVYLKAWSREVTYLEEEDLVESAVGVDTTARSQTVWQVRVLADVGAGVTCGSPDDDLEGWTDLISPSAGRLSTVAVPVPEEEDPCLTPPGVGFKGLENRLFRVEIHDAGPSGTATFKWSRDNASVGTAVTAVPDLDSLVVARVGRDAVLRFNVGDWIEVIDDWRELAGEPGIMARISDIDDATRTIGLATSLPAGLFPTTAQGETDPARHTRIRRWDQHGQVTDTDGNPLVDLDAAASPGVIPVPADRVSVVLEDGVQVTFDSQPAGGDLHGGDHWTFAARTADGTVEELDGAPPRAIHAHFARLALVTLPATVIDCRTVFPPLTGLDALEYVAGDGQEVTPVPTNPATVALPIDPTVGVARGPIPVAGRTVRFSRLDGVGSIDGAAGPVTKTSGADGLASVAWSLDPGTPMQRLEAVLLDDLGQPTSLPVRFSARLRTADVVAYDPSECEGLVGITNVQDAIDALCETRGDDPGFQVKDVFLLVGNVELRNDTEVPLEFLAKGIAIVCTDAVDPAAVEEKPTCFLTLELPYPLVLADQDFWQMRQTVAYQPLVLAASVTAQGETILWRPDRVLLEWLQRVLIMLAEFGRDQRVLVRLTVQGDFIWSADDPRVFLDGDTLGTPGGANTELLRRDDGTLSGDGRRGDDFRMWFWLVREGDVRRRGLVDRIDLRESVVVGRAARATLVLSAPAPAGGLTLTVRSADAKLVKVPETVFVEAGRQEVRFMVNSIAAPRAATKEVRLEIGSGDAALTRTIRVTRAPG